MRADEIERYGRSLSPNLLRDWVFPKLGLFGGADIRRAVMERLGERTIESPQVRVCRCSDRPQNGAACSIRGAICAGMCLN